MFVCYGSLSLIVREVDVRGAMHIVENRPKRPKPKLPRPNVRLNVHRFKVARPLERGDGVRVKKLFASSAGRSFVLVEKACFDERECVHYDNLPSSILCNFFG